MFGSSGPLTAFAQTQRQPAPPSIGDLITQSEQSYLAGEEAFIKGHSDLAMKMFDQALDIILRSGRNLAQNPRLDTYYKDLVYRINQHKNKLSASPVRQQPLTPPGQRDPANNSANHSEAAEQKSPQAAQGKEAIADKEKLLPPAREELPAGESKGRARPQQADDLQNRQEVVEPALIDELSGINESELATVMPDGIKVFGRYDFEFSVAPPVFQFLNYFVAGRGRSTMEAGLKRAGRYRQMAEKIFKEERVPLDLIWLAQAESVWKPAALSRAAAKGIWQFIPSTGSRYGLAQTSWIDDRSHPEKSTRAAARYLRFLHDYFAGDWLLAMAAYNSGEARIANSIARCGYADFWEIHKRGLIPQETRNYVPIILSIIIVSK
ncbi:MAG TPA: lytic transglycosylase domain-containing protein, partial [Blastocatellia bacterium]|nr:lytic transglycosylase domain-containing protein [Blastocatellia bacterium]